MISFNNIFKIFPSFQVLLFVVAVIMAIPYACCNYPNKNIPPDQPESIKGPNQATLDTSMAINRIAFGSCNDEDKDQNYWSDILATTPDLWIWLGDNIYGDTRNMHKLAKKYKTLKNNEYYRSFRKQVPIIGVWDDHDYGENNAGREYPMKDSSAQLLLDFLDVLPTAPQRTRKGVYSTILIGPPGKRVRIILLDARYFRDRPIRRRNGYLPNPEGTILGQAQWIWLEELLGKRDADLYIIGSGIQILPYQHKFEKWANFPNERKRLLDLIDNNSIAPCVLISGDRHIAEISKWQDSRSNKPVYEITSSGLTHSWEELLSEPNNLRISPLIKQQNFAMINIDWTDRGPIIHLQIRDIEGNILYQKTI